MKLNQSTGLEQNQLVLNAFILKPILTNTQLMGTHLVVFSSVLYNFGSKTYVGQPQARQLIRVSESGLNLDVGHISITYKPYLISGI